MTIPNESIRGPNVTIVLDLPDAEIPARINAGADGRRLAIAMSRIRMSLK